MFRRLRLLSMLLAVALLAGMLVVFMPGDEPEAKATLGPLQAVTLGAADFHPKSHLVSYSNTGYRFVSDGAQLARIPFPDETVVITSVKIRVYDNVAPNLCVSIVRTRPGDAAGDEWGEECTTGTSTADPQTLTIPNVFGRVGKYHNAYLWANFDAFDFNLKVYGATVFYRVVT